MLSETIASQVRAALYAQKYNLLLGAGISLDAKNGAGAPLAGSEHLRRKLCALTGASENSPLWRVAGLLTPAQVEENLTVPFSKCAAGPTAKMLTRFPWRAAYTLNIDDVIENAYETEVGRCQSLLSVNYTREYQTFRDPNELPLIHLHGSVRFPEDKYVFSLNEYVSVQQTQNPWMSVLSSLVISEPFIVAGTTLFEPDLEYFLAHRPTHTQVVSRAPSVLIEPCPDAGTRRDCERLNLVLVEATLTDFLAWCLTKFGSPPSPLELRQPAARPRQAFKPADSASVVFWADFELVRESKHRDAIRIQTTPFHMGRGPCWDDIYDRFDVPLHDQLPIIDEVKRWQASAQRACMLCLTGRAGAGKSTSVRRVASDLAAAGLQVFYVRATSAIDIDAAVDFLNSIEGPIVLVTDSLAEHGDELLDVSALLDKNKRICILGSERQYRMRLVNEFLSAIPSKIFEVRRWRIEERVELVQRYVARGLVGDHAALDSSRRFARVIQDNTAAEAVCRILNDFRPLRAIVRSLWNDTISETRSAYLTAALAFYSHPAGLRRDIVLSLWPADLLASLEWDYAPLRIVRHPDDEEYLVPANATISSLLLEEVARSKPDRLLDVAVRLANRLAPFVSRNTIKQRTAEARLAGRLFDADGVLPGLLKARFTEFLDRTIDRWRWNSRYWEQKALYIEAQDTRLALQHARHAVSIERHPYPMTTLASILFGAARQTSPPDDEQFGEAIELMRSTLRIEAQWDRGKTRKSFWVLLDGTRRFIDAGGTVTPGQRRFLESTCRDARRRFSPADDIYKLAERLTAAIGRS